MALSRHCREEHRGRTLEGPLRELLIISPGSGFICAMQWMTVTAFPASVLNRMAARA